MTVISYAQNFEDVMLWRALRGVENGFYIDVGAQRPSVDSVTRLFYERGWRGINIEPVQQWHLELVEQRPRDINLNVAAGRDAGQLTLNVFAGTGLSTAVDAHASVHAERGFERLQVQVPVRTLQSICEEYHVAPIHFLKIDVEGFEADVLAGIDLALVRPWIVVVEATLPNSRVANYADWEPILLQADYDFVYFDGLNRYYVARERAALAESFSSPPNVFDDFTLSGTASNSFSVGLLERLDRAEAGTADAQATCVRLESELAEARTGLHQAVEDTNAHARRIETLLREGADAQAHHAEVRYELDISRKRLAADMRSLEARDGRIRMLEEKLDVERERLHGALDAALARLGSDLGQRQGALETGIAKLEALIAQKLAAAEAGVDRARQDAADHARDLSEAVRDLAELRRAHDASQTALERERQNASDTLRDLADVRLELAASLDNAHHWFVLHGQAVATLEARLAEVLDSNHQWFMRAGEFERRISAFEASRSWRLTAPLRALRRGPVAVTKGLVRAPVLATMRALKRHPRLWAAVSQRLKAHPRLFNRLKASALAANVVQAPAYAPPDAGVALRRSQEKDRRDISAYQLRLRRRIRSGD